MCRALKRNTPKGGYLGGVYDARNAQRRTDIRHKTKAKQRVFDELMKQTISRYLEHEKFSPELISKCSSGPVISHGWIYRWIWKCKFIHRREDLNYRWLYESLKHGRRRIKRRHRRDSRGIIPDRIPIEMRPSVVSKRKRLGDLEIDLMMGKNHNGALSVMTDRATLHTRMVKLNNQESKTVLAASVNRLSRSSYPIRTLTFDNDQAFSTHKSICDKKGAKSYFTRPYTSQDKGTVENPIGVIRRFFPKGLDLTTVTQREVNRVEHLINNRPVRKFNYLTPNQVLQGKIALIR
ncbi:MAG: IS30 family transposase [Bacteroidota bacterium]